MSLGIQGFQAYEQMKHDLKIERGMKILVKRQNFDHKKIMHLEEDLMSLSQATLTELKSLGKELHMTGVYVKHLAERTKELTIKLITADQQIHDNSNAII